ncbi:hypothetical protein DBR40_05030 [Pedobacter sp. KBW01]|nr:hypothetical protein DBR40_05030 [Pedobacter sp. KBW01]
MQVLIDKNIKFEYHEKLNSIFPDLYYRYWCIVGWYNYEKPAPCIYCRIWSLDTFYISNGSKIIFPYNFISWAINDRSEASTDNLTPDGYSKVISLLLIFSFIGTPRDINTSFSKGSFANREFEPDF